MKKIFIVFLMSAFMQTVSAQCNSTSCTCPAASEKNASQEEGADGAKAAVSAEDGNVGYNSLLQIVAQKSSDKVQALLKGWNYEIVSNGMNSGVFKYGKAQYDGSNWMFAPSTKWAGVEYKCTANGVANVKWMFSSKECYEQTLNGFKNSDWVKEAERNTGDAMQTDFRKGKTEFVSIYAYSYGIYAIIYSVYASL